MGKVTGGAGVVAATAATLVVKRALDRAGITGRNTPEDAERWRVVTVFLPEEQVGSEGRWPEPLAAWGDTIEVRTAPAPGGRGTELSARLRDGKSGSAPDDLDGETPVQKLRSALRRAKQLLETGEILRATEPGTSEPTVTNAPLRAAVEASGGEGRL